MMKFVSLVAVALTGAALFADEPLLKFGVLSDIHITADGDGSNVSTNSTAMFRKALGYFDEQKVDAVVVAGDLANDGRVAELLIVGKLWDEVFPNGKGSDGRPVDKVFIYGNHDPNRWPSRNTHGEKLIIDDPAGAWEQAFHEPYKPVYVKSVKGYDFVCAHWGQEGRAVEQIESAGKSGRPFFHVQHPNMLGTVHGGKVGQDCGAVFSVLSKFPQAVSFSGHSHLPLENEQAIWQGAFTAVNTAALRYIAISSYRSSQFPRSYENGMVKKHCNADADGPKVMYCEHYHTDLHEGLLVSVYSDRIVFSRREFGADVPIGADWVVPLDGSRPYDLETRRKAVVPPEFPAEAKLTVSRVQAEPVGGKKGEKVDAWELRFPVAKGAYEYEITGTGPDGKPVVSWVFATKKQKVRLAASRFAADKVSFEVVPVDSLGCRGVALTGLGLWANGKPVFKVGIVTDTHVGSCFTRDASRVRQAAELFKREEVDAIVNVGDICDWHEPKFYEAYRRAVDEVFPPEKPHPLEYFVYAFHDAFAYKGHARNQATKDQHEAFADVRKYLRAANPPEFETTICGYPMVFIRQFHEAEQLEELIVRAERAFPGKPVFVFSHVPPFNTTSGNGSVEDRKMLNRHPRVIQISGHTHGTLLNERNIWQGEFTAVNAGCLQVWGKDRIHNYGALVMEVCEDAVMFRRYDVRDGHEIGADEPWCVPLPFDPATAPFRLERRRAVSVAPEFPSGAELKVTSDEDGRVMVSFPSVEGMPRAFCYRIRATRRTVDGSQILFNAQPVGDFYLAPLERKGDVVQSFPEGWLDAGERATVTVTPVNFFDKAGRALSTEIVGRPRDARCVFDCPSPMQKMTFCHDDGTEGFELKDGFWAGQRGLTGRLMLPTEFVRGKEPVRVILDLHTSTPAGERFRAQVCGADSPWNHGLSNTLAIEPGAGVSSRVVLEYVPKVDVGEQCVYFYLLGDGKCRVRFDRVRIERPSPEKEGT